jgi:hypothetical protein
MRLSSSKREYVAVHNERYGQHYVPAWLRSCGYVPLAFFIALETQCSEAMHIFDGGFVASHFLL